MQIHSHLLTVCKTEKKNLSSDSHLGEKKSRALLLQTRVGVHGLLAGSGSKTVWS